MGLCPSQDTDSSPAWQERPRRHRTKLPYRRARLTLNQLRLIHQMGYLTCAQGAARRVCQYACKCVYASRKFLPAKVRWYFLVSSRFCCVVDSEFHLLSVGRNAPSHLHAATSRLQSTSARIPRDRLQKKQVFRIPTVSCSPWGMFVSLISVCVLWPCVFKLTTQNDGISTADIWFHSVSYGHGQPPTPRCAYEAFSFFVASAVVSELVGLTGGKWLIGDRAACYILSYYIYIDSIQGCVRHTHRPLWPTPPDHMHHTQSSLSHTHSPPSDACTKVVTRPGFLRSSAEMFLCSTWWSLWMFSGSQGYNVVYLSFWGSHTHTDTRARVHTHTCIHTHSHVYFLNVGRRDIKHSNCCHRHKDWCSHPQVTPVAQPLGSHQLWQALPWLERCITLVDTACQRSPGWVGTTPGEEVYLIGTL